MKGRSTYPSFIGSLLTLVITFFVFAYGLFRLTVLLDRADTSFNSTKIQKQVSKDEILTQEQTNLYMVFRFTRPDRIVKAQDINEYISLVATNTKIDTASGTPTADYSELIAIRPCLERDLTINMYNSDVLVSQVEQLWCLDDPTDFKLKGLLQNNYAEETQFLVGACRGDHCKSE